jgi:hypothetical protein
VKQSNLFPVERVREDGDKPSIPEQFARRDAYDAWSANYLWHFYRRRLPGILSSNDRTRIFLWMEWQMRHPTANFYEGYPEFVLRQLQYHFEQIQGWLWRDSEPEGEYAELIAAQLTLIAYQLKITEEQQNVRPDAKNHAGDSHVRRHY